jgi:MFS family permease
VKAAPPPEPPPAEDLFSNRPFLLFWWARVFTAGSFQMLAVAVGWKVYEITGNVTDLGLVGLVEFLPRLLFMLHAGAVADRVQRGRLILVTRLIQGSTVALMAWGAWQGRLGRDSIFALVFALGAVRTFEMPATQALLPQLVPPRLLPRALATASSSLQAATILAPALAGFLYAFGSATVFTVSAALYFLAAALTSRLPLIASARAAVKAEQRWNGLLGGFSYIRQHPDILGAISLDLFAVLLGGATALLPAIARDILKTGPWGLGLLRSAPAVGALLVSLRMARHPPRRKVGRKLFAAVALYGAATLAFGLSGSFAAALASLIVMGGADMVSVIIRSSLVQLETPDAMRGRVSAVSGLFIGASNQLGEFESGITAGWFGVGPAVLLGGAGSLAVAILWMRWFPSLARRDTLRHG